MKQPNSQEHNNNAETDKPETTFKTVKPFLQWLETHKPSITRKYGSAGIHKNLTAKHPKTQWKNAIMQKYTNQKIIMQHKNTVIRIFKSPSQSIFSQPHNPSIYVFFFLILLSTIVLNQFPYQKTQYKKKQRWKASMPSLGAITFCFFWLLRLFSALNAATSLFNCLVWLVLKIKEK
jgi:hypothetical protein